ncbi:hypothetical protein Q5752_006014 [Cryptotrichosporon argae]
MAGSKKDKGKFTVTFGPLEQAITVLVIMGFASNPDMIPWNPFAAAGYGGPGLGGSVTNIPLFSPPMVMLVVVAYAGYYLLSRQAAERERLKTLAKAASSSSSSSSSSKSSSSSSSSSKAASSADVRAGKAGPSSSSSSKTGSPAPKQVSGKPAADPRTDPASAGYRGNYFLTMQGPGRPALVPFQAGLRPKKGATEGTMWWDNVPEDAKDLMAPPVDPKKAKQTVINPYIVEMIGQDIELLKLRKQQREEDERYAKVTQLMQTILAFLLCLVDMRLGVLAFVYFLWAHFSALHARDLADDEDEIEKEKKALEKAIKEARASVDSADQRRIRELQKQLKRLG